MARRPGKACSNRGCSRLNCTEHVVKVVRKPDTREKSAYRRGYDLEWRRIRAAYLRRYKWCVVCGELATQVDHLGSLSSGGTNKWINLQGLCHSCHSRKTAVYDRGFGNRSKNIKYSTKRMGGGG
jgi:5-methylcytosine-specific restriction protein A